MFKFIDFSIKSSSTSVKRSIGTLIEKLKLVVKEKHQFEKNGWIKIPSSLWKNQTVRILVAQ